ncbi:MAG: hypothetical protein RR931_05830, partial [Mucinivorans sp.]
APTAAEVVSNHFMQKDNYTYNANVPALYHQLNRTTISPQAYSTLAGYAKSQNVITYDETLLANFVPMAAGSDSIANTPTVENRFGKVLSTDKCIQIDNMIDSAIIQRFSLLIPRDKIPVQAVKETVLARFTPVTDSSNLQSQIQGLNTINDKFAYDNNITAKQLYDDIITKFNTIPAQIKGVLAAGINTELATLINRDKLLAFSSAYTVSMSTSFNYGFGVACLSLVLSMLVFLIFRNTYAKADRTEKQKAALTAAGKGDDVTIIELTPAQVKERMVALGLVFLVVIFFWMAFHQNGLTMTFFARDYTQSTVSGVERFGFSLLTLLPFAVMFYGILNIFQSKGNTGKLAGLGAAVIGCGLAYWAYSQFAPSMEITPQIFQQFNAFFIVILTPVAVAFFSWLNSKGKEPLAPRKIGIGMIIAALGFVILAVGSIGLPTPDTAKSLGSIPTDMLVSPNWLISTYFVLTIAELFLSPMGISFVSKVAPPKYKGLAQGGWLAATAIGNYLVAVVGYLWGGLELWMVWGILVTLCLLSAAFLFSQMKKLENTTRNA